MRKLLLSLTIAFVACESKEPPKKPMLQAEQPKADPNEIDPVKLQIFAALPEKMPRGKTEISEARVKLGRILFYETRLSQAGTLSCNSCHELATYGVDNRTTSEGHNKQPGPRNTPLRGAGASNGPS